MRREATVCRQVRKWTIKPDQGMCKPVMNANKLVTEEIPKGLRPSASTYCWKITAKKTSCTSVETQNYRYVTKQNII